MLLQHRLLGLADYSEPKGFLFDAALDISCILSTFQLWTGTRTRRIVLSGAGWSCTAICSRKMQARERRGLSVYRYMDFPLPFCAGYLRQPRPWAGHDSL
eukprot:2914514-Amphidinium_carterae.1